MYVAIGIVYGQIKKEREHLGFRALWKLLRAEPTMHETRAHCVLKEDIVDGWQQQPLERPERQ